MGQERRLTPEKQLLNLIEGDGPKSSVALGAVALKRKNLSFFSPGAWTGRISFFNSWFKKRSGSLRLGRRDTIKLINRALVVFIFILGAYFALNIFLSAANLKNIPGQKPLPQEGGVSQAGFPSLMKQLNFYLDKVRARDIFRLGVKKAEVSEGSPKGPSEALIEATGHLRLVGISWSNNPDAMIEDTKAGKTFFVKTGQNIGEVKVQAILRDKVILLYGGEEIELR